MRRLCATLLLVLGTFGFAQAPSGTNWMAQVADDHLISSLSIPGTHNAGALREPLPNTARCQDASIAKQLSFGVRLLDMRCRHKQDRFDIFHGMADQKRSFAAVLKDVQDFLVANPSECVVMSIAQTHRAENNTRSFSKTLTDYIAAQPKLWHLEAAPQKLGEVRGKIVLLRRFGFVPATAGPRVLGIDATQWPGNRSFRKNGLQVQDRYKAKDNAEKWAEMTKAFKAASAEKDPAIIHLNFSSGYQAGAFGLPNIRAVSKVINPKLQAHLTTSPAQFHGWVMMDFATPELTKLVYEKSVPAK